jgi:hypothetical protein
MLGPIVKRYSPIDIGYASGKVADNQRGSAQQAMSDHDRCCRSLLLR